jgi:hypothetical protein
MSSCVIQNVVKHLPHYTVSHYMVAAFRISNSTVQNKVKEFNTQNVFMYHHTKYSTFITTYKPHFQVKKRQHRSFNQVFHLYSFLFATV